MVMLTLKGKIHIQWENWKTNQIGMQRLLQAGRLQPLETIWLAIF